jgi:tripartite-type tricarboxylate transporter receptor subunit TctC
MNKFAVMIMAVASGSIAPFAQAQEYPVRTIRLVVPSPPGGTSDIMARFVAPKLSEALGQPVVVDNRGGASATIGTALVLKSAPDGYTIGITPASLAINPSMFAKLPYDTLRDLAPVSRLVEGPSMLMVHPSIPVRSIRELIALAKANPGRLAVASSGLGSIPHLAHELFGTMAGIDMPQVLFKGSGPAMISVISGEIAAFYGSPISVMQLLKAGKLRALGVTTKTRSQALPEVPTIAETLPGYEATQWFAIFAPAGTPRPIIERLSQELARALRAPDLKTRLVADGLEVIGSTPDEFARYLKSDMEKWARVIKAAGIKPEE